VPGIYRPRHPERTVLYRVLFHQFERFVAEYESRFERDYGYFRPIVKEVVERYLDCGNPRCGFARIRRPRCRAGGQIHDPLLSLERLSLDEQEGKVCYRYGKEPEEVEMKIIAFLTDYAVVDRIIDHLKLTVVAERPPPPQRAYQEVLMAAEASTEYFS
jgi:hypothetical protein